VWAKSYVVQYLAEKTEEKENTAFVRDTLIASRSKTASDLPTWETAKGARGEKSLICSLNNHDAGGAGPVPAGAGGRVFRRIVGLLNHFCVVEFYDDMALPTVTVKYLRVTAEGQKHTPNLTNACGAAA
jgi:hypothetical protein